MVMHHLVDIKIRRPASALLDKLLCPPDLGVLQPQAEQPPPPLNNIFFISPLYCQNLYLFWRIITLSEYALPFQCLTIL